MCHSNNHNVHFSERDGTVFSSEAYILCKQVQLLTFGFLTLALAACGPSNFESLSKQAVDEFYARRAVHELPHTLAYIADVTGDQSLIEELYSQQNRDGGWGVDEAWDAFGDGTINSADTTYTITLTDHVGLAFLDLFERGAISGRDVFKLVSLVENTPLVIESENYRCYSYSFSSFDNPPIGRPGCVNNVSASVAVFLQRADRLGFGGHSTEIEKVLNLLKAARPWTYEIGREEQVDLNHEAFLAEQYFFLSGDAGPLALVLHRRDSKVPSDIIGQLRLEEVMCDDQMYYFLYQVSSDEFIQSLTTRELSQLALWSRNVHENCE